MSRSMVTDREYVMHHHVLQVVGISSPRDSRLTRKGLDESVDSLFVVQISDSVFT